MASIGDEYGKKYGRYPSSVAMSYKSVSPEDMGERKRWWNTVKDSLVGGTLVAVGLKPTEDERRHWRLMEAYASELDKKAAPAKEETDGITAASIEAEPLPYTPSMLMRQVTKYSLRPEEKIRSVKSIQQNKGTGRHQAVNTNLKPDLWRVVYDSLKTRTKKPEIGEEPSKPEKGEESSKTEKGEEPSKKVSFLVGDLASDDESDDEPDGVPQSPLSRFTLTSIKERDERFFDYEVDDSRDETDSAHPVSPISIKTTLPPPRKSAHIKVKGGGKEEEDIIDEPRRRGRFQKIWGKATLSGGYLDGYGGLGAITKLLNFKYTKISARKQCFLDTRFLYKRPYFTYWLMMVHTIIMIVALSVYGFAPYGFDLQEERAFVRQTDLSLAPTSKLVVPSAWGGPPQQALVLLGAIFAPCMRSDRQIMDGIGEDRQMENSSSGCCVHRDGSGCFQTQMTACLPRFSDFIFEGNDSTRAVCGTSPNTCLEPSREFSAGLWLPGDILTWPICVRDTNANSTEKHLTCEVTSRPCCYGTQAICIITTPDHCDFLSGRFHQDAFLCSQVDCLNDICGLLPFAEFNQPDQFYRLWLALFLHAGLIHLLLSLLFSFFVLRHVEKRLGWARTTVIYVLSGIGGNLVSAYLSPYNPEVGPAGSVLGIISYFFIFLIFESRLLKRPWVEFLKLLGVTVVFLLMGFLPFIDNLAHLGGFVFGFLVSGVLVPFKQYQEFWRLTNENPRTSEIFFYVKIVLVVGGLVGVVSLFVLFFVLLYVVQSTWAGFSFLTCIPFTSTLCLDQQEFIRNRTQFII